jgi:methionyl-tRNA synthetase
VTVIDAIYLGTLYEILSSAKDLSKYPLLSAWFAVVSSNQKMIAGIEHIKEQVCHISFFFSVKFMLCL